MLYTYGQCTFYISWANKDSVLTHDNLWRMYLVIMNTCAVHGAGGGVTAADNSFWMKIVTTPSTSAAQLESRSELAVLEKRVCDSWKTGWTMANAKYEGAKVAIQSGLPGTDEGPKSSWTLSTTDTLKVSVKYTIGVEADVFEMFKVTQSLEIGMEQSYEKTSTETILNECGAGTTGYLYWTPLFTQYHGGCPGNGPHDIWIPQTSTDGFGNAVPAGAFEVRCA
jgi:hypothetical protein